jgi:hypothetical protein
MDVLKESFNRLISPYFFWKAFLSQGSFERDKKISESLRYWLEGGLALYGLIVGAAILLFGETSVLTYDAKLVGVFIVIMHIWLQFICGRTPQKRYLDRKRDEKIEKINKWFYDRLQEAYEEGRKEKTDNNWFNEESGKGSQYENSHFNHSKEEFLNKNYDEVDIEKVLERFNLPKDTNDMSIIRKRYRELAKKYHPDMEHGDANLFKQVVADFEFIKYFFEQKAS